MKALVYKDEFDVTVEEVPELRIEGPNDAIVKITTTNICGSDLDMYEGRTNVETGTLLGHENMGVVAEVGPGVDRIKPGDRVSVPFNIACGSCGNCVRGWTSFCLRTNPTDGTRERPASRPSRAGSASTTGPCSARASRWARGSAR